MKPFLLLVFFPCILFSQSVRRVLFIGNSYTGVNNLPHMTAQVAAANGDTLIYDSNTPGGYTFQMHSTDATTLSKIAQGNWDVVVLQEQSQLPSFSPAQVASQVLPHAARLDSLVKAANPCTETMFYMTWGRKYGDAQNCAVYPPVCTYEGMQSRLRESYLEMGTGNSSSVAPVGMAWKRVRDIDTTIELYQSDNSHPSVAGSYVAAGSFYSSIFHRPFTGSSYTAGLPAAQVNVIQQAVDFVVFDSLQQWQEAGNLAFADFDFVVNANTVSFNNRSLNATTYQWSFGDGNVSPLSNPTHVYSTVASYAVSLTASNNCNSEVLSRTVDILTTSVDEADGALRVFVADNFIVAEQVADADELLLFNQSGQIVWRHQLMPGTQRFRLPYVPAGCYVSVVKKTGVLQHTQRVCW